MKTNRGFVPIVILVIILAVLLVGGGSYYLGNKKTNSPVVDENIPQLNEDVTKSIIPETTSVVTVVKPESTPSSNSTINKDYKSLCKGDSICQKYFDVWKKEQFSRNGYNESYFNKHIVPESMSINKWNSGESFNIIYNINIDWASIKTADSFLVKLSPNEDTYQYLNIPKDTYLDEGNIDIIINKLAFNSTFTLFKPIDYLFYKTINSVSSAIETKAGRGFEFEVTDIEYKSSRPLTSATIAVPILRAYNRSDCNKNKLKEATVNLITGEIAITDSVCYMN